MNIAPLIMVEAAGGGGGGSMTPVQAPVPAWSSGSSTMTQTISAVGSGNSIVVQLSAGTAAGAPTSVTDSGSNTYTLAGSPYVAAGGQTFRYYICENITNAPTSVTATFSGSTDGFISVAEVPTTLVTLDSAVNGAAQTTNTSWTYPVTTTVNGVLLMATGAFTNGSASVGVSPMVAGSFADAGDYACYGYGVFPTAGSNTGEITLTTAARNGDKAWAAFRAGA
jgi:hypothetical protein